jgi:tRNA(fMet)-specific endonuclease VapC
MYILDTNVLTALHIGNPKIINAIQKIGNERVAITVVTKVEMLRGRIDFLLKAENAFSLRRAQALLTETEERLNAIETLPFDDDAIAQFEQLITNSAMRKAGRADLLIASIVLSQQATLVTRNRKDFQRFPNLRLVNWFD